MATRTCVRCGTSFPGRSDARYCGGSCRSASSRERKQRRTDPHAAVDQARCERMEMGAVMLGITCHPHQLHAGELLDEAHETTVFQWPRRAGKTTSIWSWILGRCEDEPGTLVATTAQSGIKARHRFLDIKRMLDRHYPEEAGGPKIYKGVGQESIEWENGSRLWVMPPDDDSARGDAANILLADETQALNPAGSLDLEQGVMPMFDTVENGQIILAGTPGKVRSGWYWNALQAALNGREGIVHGLGEPGYAASIYAAVDGDDFADEDVWRRVHPGIGTLTTMATMRTRYARYASDPLRWAMEYLGIWPGMSTNRAIPEDLWSAASGDFVEMPDRFGLAFDTSPDSSTSALMAAWRDDDGRAHLEVLMHATPRDVGVEALRIARKYKLAVAWDNIGANLDVAEGLRRAKPKPKMTPFKMGDVVTSNQVLMRELRNKNLSHPDQPALNEAAEAAAWRTLGDSGQLFGRRASDGDVTPIVAGAVALLAYDRLPADAPVKIYTRVSA